MDTDNGRVEQQPHELVELALRKSADNAAFTDMYYHNTWAHLSGWKPARKFQPGELTTGQAAEELHVTAATVGAYYRDGRFPHAWREDLPSGRPGWIHIPEEDVKAILDKGIAYYSNPMHALEATRKLWARQFTVKQEGYAPETRRVESATGETNR